MSAALQGTASAALSIQRVKYHHDAMIDLLIANPAISQGELARTFGMSQGWISRVLNSDAFQARLAERKTDIVDPVLMMSFDEKLRALASKSLDVVMDKLERNDPKLDAARVLEISTRALGYGAKQANVSVQTAFVVAMPAKVVDAAAWAELGRQAGAMAGAREVPLEVLQEVPPIANRQEL